MQEWGNCMKKLKLSKIELILLVIMFICYIITLYFILVNNRYYFLVFFIIHSCLVIAFFFASQAEFTKNILDISYSQMDDEYRVFEENASIITRLKQEKDDLLYEIESLTNTNQNQKKEIEELTVLLSEAELRKNIKESDILPNNHSILPAKELCTNIDLIEIMKTVIDEKSILSNKKGVDISISCANLNITMYADYKYIKTLFINLLDNSIKYSKPNGRIVITISNIGDSIFIVFKDSGNGIPVGNLENLFELNYQGTNALSGSGLGLTQAKAIVNHYNGTIAAKNDSGMGIYIQFPNEPS